MTMKTACDPARRRRLDPALRRHVMAGGALLGLISLIGGFYLGFGLVTNDAALASPMFEKFWLNIFIAISCGTAGMIVGAFIGGVAYRMRNRGKSVGNT